MIIYNGYNKKRVIISDKILIKANDYNVYRY